MSAIGEAFLAHHLAFRPVDGTFMGRRDCDGLLPRADARAAAEERRSIEEIKVAVAAAPESSAAERMDKRLADAELKLAAASLQERPRFANPSWYSGEATFGIISLLLPQSAPLDVAAVRARLEALPDFLADAQARLRESGAAPKSWSERAAPRGVGPGAIPAAGFLEVFGRSRVAAVSCGCGAGAAGFFALARGTRGSQSRSRS